MHDHRQISDDGVKKLDAPAPTRSKTVVPAQEFAPLYETLANANAAVVGISDPTMRAVVVNGLQCDVGSARFCLAPQEEAGPCF
jgi:hypothetical protein